MTCSTSLTVALFTESVVHELCVPPVSALYFMSYLLLMLCMLHIRMPFFLLPLSPRETIPLNLYARNEADPMYNDASDREAGFCGAG